MFVIDQENIIWPDGPWPNVGAKKNTIKMLETWTGGTTFTRLFGGVSIY